MIMIMIMITSGAPDPQRMCALLILSAGAHAHMQPRRLWRFAAFRSRAPTPRRSRGPRGGRGPGCSAQAYVRAVGAIKAA